MNKYFNTKEICAICGHRLGVHKADDYSCPKDIGRAGEFLETKFTRITPTTEQTELWDDVFLMLHQSAQGYKTCPEAINHPGLPNHQPWHQQMIAKLKEKYSISRKQEVPEAVEFAEWCVEFYGWSDTDELWVDNPGEKYSSMELYEIFKKQKS